MLIDDESVGQSQAGRKPHAAGDYGGPFIAESDHVLAQDARAGTGAAHSNAAGIAHTDEFRDRRTAEQGGEAKLIAAGEEDPARLLQAAQAAGFLTIPPSVKIHHG